MIKINALSVAFLSVYSLHVIFSILLERLNVRRLLASDPQVPRLFEPFVDLEKLARMNAYCAAKGSMAAMHAGVHGIAVLGLIASGVLTGLQRLSVQLVSGFVQTGLLFFLCLFVLFFLLELPFDYYYTFSIEQRFGFNRSDVKTWVFDQIKGLLVSTMVLMALIAPVLWLIRVFPWDWWFWGFLSVAVVEFSLVLLYPVLVAPLFNKFDPIDDVVLEEKLRKLTEKAGLKTGGVFRMDAGKRSGHSNAYFTGLGKTRRIVLYDTLIDSHEHDEVVAVLAHEIGHFRLRHVLKSIMLGLPILLIVLYFTQRLAEWDLLYTTFGLDRAWPYSALFIIAVFWQNVWFFFRPPAAALSRRFERDADAFASRLLGSTVSLSIALKRLAVHNFANLNPHPFYVWFNYSHPPLMERLSYLERMQQPLETE